MKKLSILIIVLMLISALFVLTSCFTIDEDIETNTQTIKNEISSKPEKDKDKSSDNDYADGKITLESLAKEYEDAMLMQAAKNAGGLVGNFDIEILDKEETIENLQSYIISKNINYDKIIRGLFVKFEVTNADKDVLFTAYYNFGLEFSEEQESDIAFTFGGSNEAWLLEVVEENKCLVFEYSIAD